MPFQLLTLTVDQPHAESLSDALTDSGALSVTLEDSQDEPIFETPPDTVILWSRCKLTGLYDEQDDLRPLVLALEQKLNTAIEYSIAVLPDQDWERACLDQFKPMCFGKRLWVSPSWCEPPENLSPPFPKGGSGGIYVTLDPGLAFGTGSHSTTRLMLEWLDGADMADKTVIDYGCGSGILAIAAAKLGAARVIGVDYDPQALTATHNNAAENKVEIEAYLPADCPDIQADIILANIIVNPLIELMPVFVAHLKAGGQLILSGLLNTQVNLLLSHLPPTLTCRHQTQHEDWIRLDLIASQSAPKE